jgi:pimeloyl-ACP methyl ester carboxylesterase
MKRPPHLFKRLFLLVAVLVLAIIGFKLLQVRGTFDKPRPVSEAGGTAVVIGLPGRQIAGRVYLEGPANPSAPLVVVLHGDAPTRNPSYQYLFASRLAAAAPGTRVVALLRPGYADPYGAKSDGDRGFADGENYTSNVVVSLAGAIQLLKSQWGAPSVFLVGHSGGAAISADITALHPGLVQHAFLISCPCDVPAFRHHMAKLQWSPVWLIPTHSLSPQQTLDRMKPGGIIITAISGSDDPLALPEYSQAYIASAAAKRIPASMITIPHKGHEILLDPAVIQDIANAVRSSF